MDTLQSHNARIKAIKDTLVTRIYQGTGTLVTGSAPNYTVKADTTLLETRALATSQLATKQNKLTNPITGTLTDGYIPNASGTNTLENSSMYVDGSGNVGIGTTGPGAFSGYTTLSINNATNGGLLEFQASGTTAMRLASDGSGSSINEARNLLLTICTNATERMRILGNGNVGISTTAPYYKLDIAGDLRIQSTNKLWFSGTTGVGTDYFYSPSSGIIQTASVLKSTVATGTSPFTVASTTKVIKLYAANSDSLGNKPASDYELISNKTNVTGTSTVKYATQNLVKTYSDSVAALKANISHTQAISTITGLQDSIDRHTDTIQNHNIRINALKNAVYDSLNNIYTQAQTDGLLSKKRDLNNHDSLSTLDEKSYNSLTDKPTILVKDTIPFMFAPSGKTVQRGTGSTLVINDSARIEKGLEAKGGLMISDGTPILISSFDGANTTKGIGYNIWIGGGGRNAGWFDGVGYSWEGRHNNSLGYEALNSVTTGNENIAIGYNTMYSNTTGKENTAVGHNSMYANVSGFANVAVGTYALNMSTANFNTAVGYFSQNVTSTGKENTSLGSHSMYSNTTGKGNTALGVVAGYSIVGGKYNTMVGYYSGVGTGVAAQISISDSNMVLIGKDASKNNSTTLRNGIAIGYNTKVLQSNQVVLGNDSIQSTLLKGNIFAKGLIHQDTANYVLGWNSGTGEVKAMQNITNCITCVNDSVTLQHGMYHYSSKVTLNPDVSITFYSGAWGNGTVSDSKGTFASFQFESNGVVYLQSISTSNTSAIDEAWKLCVFDDGDHIKIRHRLSATAAGEYIININYAFLAP
jgi:hypothetical protein